MQALHDVRQATTSFVQLTCPDTTTVRTAAPPAGAVACLISCETTNGRLNFHGATPSAATGHPIIKDQNPAYFAWATTIKAVSSAAANSVISITWLF